MLDGNESTSEPDLTKKSTNNFRKDIASQAEVEKTTGDNYLIGTPSNQACTNGELKDGTQNTH